jgi:hypothetical protein
MNVQVEPNGPISNVIRIERLPHPEIAVAPGGDLPKSRRTRSHPCAKAAEFRIEPIEVLARKRARSHQTRRANQCRARALVRGTKMPPRIPETRNAPREYAPISFENDTPAVGTGPRSRSLRGASKFLCPAKSEGSVEPEQ